MSILTEIRNAATDSRHSLADALRKGLVLASLLRNPELRDWLKKELEGYPDYRSVPDYRIISASVYGNLANEYGPRLKNVRYPTDSYPDEVRSNVTAVHLHHGVRELENMIAGDEFTCLSLPHDMPLPAPYVGMKAYELWHQFHRSQVEQVLDSIRTHLLELVLDLEERFPEMKKSEEEISKVDRQAAASVVTLHIHGSQNVIAAGNDIAQTVTQQIREGDVEMLTTELSRRGVPDTELKELRSAIAEDGKPKEGKLGPRVAKWIGNVTAKALEGTITAAPTVIVQLVKKHYGLD